MRHAFGVSATHVYESANASHVMWCRRKRAARHGIARKRPIPRHAI